MTRVLLVDNYDSFTYNLFQYLRELGAEVHVVRHDRIGREEAERMRPTHMVISPGPGRPEQAAGSLALLRAFEGKIPVLGVCLGHQCIAVHYGGEVVRADRVVHGKTSRIHHDGRGIFQGLPNPFEATRYHSLVVREGGVPSCLEVSAYTAEGEIMGLRHRTLPVEGVQFHPESVLTRAGKMLLENFLNAGR